MNLICLGFRFVVLDYGSKKYVIDNLKSNDYVFKDFKKRSNW